jgi:transcriptional regulator with XRE-family HTH domain
MEKFGEKLKVLRQQRGFTMRQLGELLEVSDSYVNKLETGDKIPNVAMVLKISYLFGVSADVLIKDELDLED